jgi:imidazolonepropionase-like amidohydrolase
MPTTPKYLIAGILLAFLGGCGDSALPPSSEQPVIAIVGARLIDGTGGAVIEDSVVIIEGARIQAAGPRSHTPVPKGGEIIDGAGKTIIPGLVDTHGHYHGDRAQMEHAFKTQLYFGVTTSRSIGVDPEEKVAIINEGRAGKMPMPRLYTAGLGFTHPKGHPVNRTVNRPANVEEARQNVATLAAQKVDFVKMWVDTLRRSVPKITPEIRAAIVEEAAKHNIRAVAHISEEGDVRQLIGVGVKDFLHTVADTDIGPDFIKLCLDNGVTFSPTLTNSQATWNYAEHPELLDDPETRAAFDPDSLVIWQDPKKREEVLADAEFAGRKARFQHSLLFVKVLSDAGVRIAAGTDSGGGTPSHVPMGWGTHRELQLLVEAGLTPMQALVAATQHGAGLLSRGEVEYGTIQPGKAADLVLLNADPLADIHNTLKIQRVMQAGQWLNRKELLHVE